MTDNAVKIINHAITRLLAMREHSQQELAGKLAAKGIEGDLVRQQIQIFAEKDIQSDVRFVESFIRSRVVKGQGEQRIVMELKQRGVDEYLINQGLAQCETDFYALASQVYEKKYANRPINDWLEKQKRMRFLQYRGFNTEQIQFALQNALSL